MTVYIVKFSPRTKLAAAIMSSSLRLRIPFQIISHMNQKGSLLASSSELIGYFSHFFENLGVIPLHHTARFSVIIAGVGALRCNFSFVLLAFFVLRNRDYLIRNGADLFGIFLERGISWQRSASSFIVRVK